MQASNRKNRIFVTLLAMAATAGVAATAQADATTDATQARYANVIVNYGDLDLDSEAGIKVLYARLENAAGRACGSAPVTRELRRKAQYRTCVDSKLDRAVDEVGARNLYALHRTGTVDSAG